MTVADGEVIDANELRGIMKTLHAPYMSNKRNPTDPFASYSSVNSYDLNCAQTNLFQTTTGLTNRNGVYYKDDAATYTLETQDIPLISSSSKVTVIPNYEIFELYDETDDSSIDGTKWTTVSGSPTETSTYIQVQGTANEEVRTNDLSSYSLIMLDYTVRSSTSGDARIRFSDGSNVVNIATADTSGAPAMESGTMIIRLDATNEIAYVTKRYVKSSTSPVDEADFATTPIHIFEETEYYDLSSLSTNFYISMIVTDVDANTYGRIYGLRLGKASPTTSATTSYSRNGTDFTTFTQGFGISTGSGSTITAKITGTVASSEVIWIKGFTILEELP